MRKKRKRSKGEKRKRLKQTNGAEQKMGLEETIEQELNNKKARVNKTKRTVKNAG